MQKGTQRRIFMWGVCLCAERLEDNMEYLLVSYHNSLRQHLTEPGARPVASRQHTLMLLSHPILLRVRVVTARSLYVCWGPFYVGSVLTHHTIALAPQIDFYGSINFSIVGIL